MAYSLVYFTRDVPRSEADHALELLSIEGRIMTN